MLAPPSRLTPADLPDLLALSDRLGWSFTEADLTTLLAAGEAYGHRDAQGRAVTSSFLVDYGPALAWVAAVMVDPGLRRRGLGREVVERSLADRSDPRGPTALVATPEGAALYRTMGFVEVGRVHKLVAPRPPPHPPGARLRPAGPDDLPELVRLDAAARGAPRERLLVARIRQAERAALLLDASGRPVGFGLALRQRELLYVGPVVAPDPEAALGLGLGLAAGHAGPVRIDVPDGREPLAAALVALGFTEQMTPPLMLRGERLPGGPSLFALAAQAYG